MVSCGTRFENDDMIIDRNVVLLLFGLGSDTFYI
jgi:hypothetical protein